MEAFTQFSSPKGEAGGQVWGLPGAARGPCGVKGKADHSASLMVDSVHWVSGEGPLCDQD